jgi:carbon monoxide dehydrogenase subunit G
MKVEAKGEGSHLAWEFEAEATSLSGKLMSVFGKLLEGTTRKALRQDLDDIAAAAEAEGA